MMAEHSYKANILYFLANELVAVEQGLTDARLFASATRLLSPRQRRATAYLASVEAMFYGNQYILFVYEEYKDVRLVGAPPSSIGKFGGDTDNWMWPRHTGDFSMFRIYADKNNRPADYSPNNVPYTPKRSLKISLPLGVTLEP